MPRRMLIGLFCALVFSATHSVSALDYGWDGGAGDNLWNSVILSGGVQTNWLGAAEDVPLGVDNIVLTGASNAGPVTIDLEGSTQEINRVEANGVSGAYTFDNGTLQINSAATNSVIGHNGGGELIFNSDVHLNSADLVYFNVQTSGDKITVNGDIASSALSGTTELVLTSANTSLPVGVEVTGVISDGTAQTALTAGFDGNLLHTGTVKVTGLNTYTGPTRVYAAVLEFDSISNIGGTPNALGQPESGDSTIRIGTPAAGVSNSGGLRYLGAGHTSNRVIELAGKNNDTVRIESSGTGALMLTGGIINPANSETLILGGGNAGDNTISGAIQGGAGGAITSLSKQGAGKWILSGDSSTLDGALTVGGGELVVTGSLASASGNMGRLQIESGAKLSLDGGFMNVSDFNNFSGGGFNFRSGELRIANGTVAGGSGSFTIGTNGAGALQLNGGSGLFGDISLDGADDSLSISAGSSYQFSNLDNSAGGTITASGANIQINSGGVFTHRVDSGTSSIGSAIQGAGAFTKLGAGTLEFTFNGQHAYSGPTRIEGGILRLVGASGISTNSPVFIGAGATLDLAGATGGDAFGPLTGTGTITTADSMGIEIFTNGQNATFGGAITGAGRLAKSESGTQTLTAANSYTGPTEISTNGGTLEIATGGTIIGTSNVSLSTATLSVNGGTIDTPGDIRPLSNSAVFNFTGGLVKANAIDRTINTQYLHQFNWTGGTVHLLTATTINGSTTTAVNRPFGPSLTLGSGKALIVDDALSVTGAGVLNINGGSVTADNIVAGGNISFNSGSIRLRNDQTLDTARLNALDFNSPLVANQSLTVDGVATIEAPLVVAGGSFSAGSIVNPENLILSSGTLNVTNGDLDVAAGTNVDVTSGMTVNVTNGALNVAATGEFNAINATLTFSGGVNNSGELNLINTDIIGSVVSAVGSSSTLVGSNSVSGDYAMGDGDSLTIGLGGTSPGEFDTLTIGGDATLAGALSVSLDAGFSLTVGNSFEIVDVDGTLSGTFAGLANGGLVGSFGGVDLFIDYASSGVSLVTAPGADVDLDNDGDVDGSDFLAIQRTNPALIPDWQAQYGSGLPIGASLAAVPEPTSAILLVVGCTVVAFSRRNELVS